MHDRMTKSEWLMLIILSLIWGGSFFTAKIAITHFSPLALVFWRVALAAASLYLLALILKTRLPWDLQTWRAFAGMSLLNNVVPMTLIFYGLTQLSSSLTAILNATTPLFTVLVMHFLGNEKSGLLKFSGLAIGFIGVVILMGSQLNGTLLPTLACLAAALSYGFSGLYGQRFKTMQVEPIAVAFGQLACSSGILFLLNLALGTNIFAPPSFKVMLAVLTLALICTGLGYILFFQILASAGATNIMLVTFLIPVSTILLGTLFLGETLQLHHAIGMGLIGLGLVAIDGRLLAKSFK